MYMYKHRLKDVSENVLGYLADSPVILTVNVIYDIDDDLSNMTSSFLQMSSSFNTSSIMNLQDSKSSIDFSSPSTVKKKQGIIFENDDVMSKINEDMKKYQSERKKTLGQEQEAK